MDIRIRTFKLGSNDKVCVDIILQTQCMSAVTAMTLSLSLTSRGYLSVVLLTKILFKSR